VLGFPEYFQEEARYAAPAAPAAPASPSSGAMASGERQAAPSTSSSGAMAASTVEPDAVVEPGGGNWSKDAASSSSASSNTTLGTIDLFDRGSRDDGGGGRRREYTEGRLPQWLRIRVRERAAPGTVKFESRFPAGFLSAVAGFVPQVAGVDLEGLVRGAKGVEWSPEKPLLDFEADGDRVEIFLEFE
jgi:hypothetical protein